MATEVLYRKWRPQTFADFAGQEPIRRTLLNAVASGKVAHAYLFSGPRGTGKTSAGRLLARAVNCADAEKRGGDACNECESCRLYLENRALDLIEMDAASNRGIDEIRSLREKVGFAPTSGRYKVYLIDEVHMLTEPAFNALLKTLEEPPGHVIFVLATTEAHKVPATIASRCQRFDFRRFPLETMVQRLAQICRAEGVECPDDALALIARQATGSMRDAINLLEQVMDSYGGTLTIADVQAGLGLVGDERAAALAAHAVRQELGEGLAVIASARDDGLDLRQFQREVVAHLRSLLLTKAGATSALGLTQEETAELRSLAEDATADQVVRALKAFGAADLRADPQSPLPLELALAECALDVAPAGAARPSATAERPPAPPRPKGRIAAWEKEEAAAAPTRPTAPAPAPAPEPAAPVRVEGPLAAARDTAPERAAAVRVKGPPAEARDTAPDPVEVPAPATAPEPVEGPPAAAADGAASSAVEAARGRWDEIYALTRQHHFRAGALLNSGCDIIGEDDGTLVFGFRFKIHLDQMTGGDDGANLKALQRAVSEVLGREYKIRCELAPNVEQRRATSSRGGHLVEAARQMGARVLQKDEGPADKGP